MYLAIIFWCAIFQFFSLCVGAYCAGSFHRTFDSHIHCAYFTAIFRCHIHRGILIYVTLCKMEV